MEQLGEPAVPRELALEEVLLRVHPADRAAVNAVLDGYRAGGRREHRTEFRSAWPDGTVATLMSVGRLVEVAPGAGPWVVGVQTDLTQERGRAARADEANAERTRLLADSDAARRALLSLVEDLRLSQQTQQETLEQYRALVAHAPVAIFVNRGGVITLANEACVRLLGRRDASELIGKTPLDVFDPVDHPRVLERIGRLRRERQPVEPIEYTITRPDGVQVTVEASASPFEDHGETSIHVVLRDVTEQRRAAMDLIALNAALEERVRERTSELENAYRELESFSYSVSHDLRAPLRAITGFSQILGRRYRDQLDETGRHYLDNIATAGERMGTLIEDLLGYSRVGRRDVRHEPLDVRATTDAVMATLAPRIIEAGASIGIEGDPAVPLGDPTLFQQVMLNLIGNGLAYARPDVPADVTVRSERVGDHVEVSVQDNGIGIAPEHHERVFEVFARLHTEDEIPGTGIGLAIVRKAARLMEGEVRLESTPGEGSRFTLRLMAAPAEVGPDARAGDAPTPADPLDGQAA
jgi:PAS domain S-box-containing protein